MESLLNISSSIFNDSELILIILLALLTVYCFVLQRGRIKVKQFPRVVVITGCDNGFGKLASVSLQSLGFHVISACLTDNGANDLEGLVQLAVRCNITKDADVVSNILH